MSELWKIGLFAAAIIGLILLFKRDVERNIKTKHESEKQIEQLTIKENVIETKNFQQKLISKSHVSSDADSRRKFLQLVFEERAYTDR